MISSANNLGFGARLKISVGLFKATMNLIKQDKEMLLFPIISTLVIVGSLVVFAFGVISGSVLIGFAGATRELFYAYLFLSLWGVYVITYFISNFFKVAVIDSAMVRLDGKDPTFSSGIKKSIASLKPIFVWSLVGATFGLIMNLLSSAARNNKNALASIIQRIVLGILGTAWAVITYFVLPISVYEKMGVFKAMKRTVGLLRGSWLEAFISNAGAGLVFAIAMIFTIFTPIGIAFVYPESFLFVFPVFLILFVGIILIKAVFDSVLTAVLYRYAKTGTLPKNYAQYIHPLSQDSHNVQYKPLR